MPIPILPSLVTYEYVKPALTGLGSVPIGITKNNLNIRTYDYTKGFMHLISSKSIEEAAEFALKIGTQIQGLENVELTILDAEGLSPEGSNYKQMAADFVNNILYNLDETATENEETASEKSQSVCMIVGVDRFVNNMQEQGLDFILTLKKAKSLGNYTFIIVESVGKLKNHEHSDWYKNCIKSDEGIWVGNGISEQFLIKIEQTTGRVPGNIGNNFGYVINKGKILLVKLLEMQEEGEEE
ncbi:MAG: hypothetical protein FWC79_03240 [Oscillospiraceae bacterium]|nr:hypothetical protein [Oscillospiraceae bacterium]